MCWGASWVHKVLRELNLSMLPKLVRVVAKVTELRTAASVFQLTDIENSYLFSVLP